MLSHLRKLLLLCYVLLSACQTATPQEDFYPAASMEDEDDNNARPLDSIENPTEFDGGISLGEDLGGMFEDQHERFNNIPQYCNDESSSDLALTSWRMRSYEFDNRIGDIELWFQAEEALRERSDCLCGQDTISLLDYNPHKEYIIENYFRCADRQACNGLSHLRVGHIETVVECVSPLFAVMSFRDYDNIEVNGATVSGFASNFDFANGVCRVRNAAWGALSNARDQRDERYEREQARYDALWEACPDNACRRQLQAPVLEDLSDAQNVYLVMFPNEASGIYYIESQLRFDENPDLGEKRLSGSVVEPLVSSCLLNQAQEVEYNHEISIFGRSIGYGSGNYDTTLILNDPTEGQGTSVAEGESLEVLRNLQFGGDPLAAVKSCIKESLRQIYKDTIDHWYESQPVPYDPIAQDENENQLIREKDNDGDGACNLIDWCDDGAITQLQFRNNIQLSLMNELEGRVVDNRDQDGDGIADICDLCVNETLGGDPEWLYREDLDRRVRFQPDDDGDGVGDSCDVCAEGDDRFFDADNDGWCLGNDNCPVTANPSQTDFDFDGFGDSCDACPLRNNSIEGLNLRSCQVEGDFDPRLTDRDGDDYLDEDDNCPDIYNPSQDDDDRDGIGNVCEDDCERNRLGVCDNDFDGDRVINEDDNCPEVFNDEQRDADQNGIGDLCDENCRDIDFDNNCDLDFDLDGVPDEVDNCYDLPNPSQGDEDFDDVGFICDNCPDVFNPDQYDFDEDGIGDMCDTCPETFDPSNHDQDGDGIGDACEDEPCQDLNGDGDCSEGELDSDGDGILDQHEVEGCEEIINSGFDINENGIDDACDPDCFDRNGDGVDECHQDTDGDTIYDRDDNCPDVPNVDQVNTGGLDLGDACEDRDGDEILDIEDKCPDLRWLVGNEVSDLMDSDRDGLGDNCDNCPLIANPEQSDLNANGIGTRCDPDEEDNNNGEDMDGDGIPDDQDNCPQRFNDTQSDYDEDGVGDRCDNCQAEFNPDQNNQDNDSMGDVCDLCPEIFSFNQDLNDDDLGDECTDSDGDGVVDMNDNCVDIPNPDQSDRDDDSMGDLCDLCPDLMSHNNDDNNDGLGDECNDIDGDGIIDADDNCPEISNRDQLDEDNDGYGDSCDNCPEYRNQNDLEDTDGDGIVDFCGELANDIDGDGILDENDNCLTVVNPDQLNDDGDLFGNACDYCPDTVNMQANDDTDLDGFADRC